MLRLPNWYNKTNDKDNKEARLDAWKLAVEQLLELLDKGLGETKERVFFPNNGKLSMDNLEETLKQKADRSELHKHEPSQLEVVSVSEAEKTIIEKSTKLSDLLKRWGL